MDQKRKCELFAALVYPKVEIIYPEYEVKEFFSEFEEFFVD